MRDLELSLATGTCKLEQTSLLRYEHYFGDGTLKFGFGLMRPPYMDDKTMANCQAECTISLKTSLAAL